MKPDQLLVDVPREELERHDTNPDQLFHLVISAGYVQDIKNGPFAVSEITTAHVDLETYRKLIDLLRSNEDNCFKVHK